MREIGLIAGLSVCGVLARYAIGIGVARWFAPTFPWATFAINILGSFCIGMISGLGDRALLSEEWRVAIMVGLLGGFTTFSAFSLETLRLYENGDRLLALTYLVLSPLLAVLCCFIGRQLTR